MSAFRTTLWSRLDAAARGSENALDDFARTYRPPLVSFIRGRGYKEDAEDIAQEVFIQLLSKELLARGDASKGRFRNYLIGVTLHVISGRRRRKDAAKRGGKLQHVPLDLAPPPAEVSQEFERIWLRELIDRALKKVAELSEDSARVLTLAIEGRTPTEIGEELGKSPNAARVSLHRARARLAEAIRDEVAAYCSTQEEYELELKSFAAFLPDA